MIKMEELKVTPEIAARFLKESHGNRVILDERTDLFSKVIKEGGWRPKASMI